MYVMVFVYNIGILSLIVVSKQLQLDLDIDLSKPKSCLADQNFDHLLLAVQWAPGFCYNKACGNRNNNQWTIHGLWPQNLDNSWPQYCCFEKDFDIKKIKSLENRLINAWPTLKSSKSHQSFWKKQWIKHGTCAVLSEQLRDQFNYFNSSLALYDLFPLKSWLNLSNITPNNSDSYKLSDIHESVEKRLGSRVELECLSESPHPLLRHIYICLERNSFKPIDCTRDYDKGCGNFNALLPSV